MHELIQRISIPPGLDQLLAAERERNARAAGRAGGLPPRPGAGGRASAGGEGAVTMEKMDGRTAVLASLCLCALLL